MKLNKVVFSVVAGFFVIGSSSFQNGKLVCKAGTPEPVGYASGNAHWQSNK